MDFLTSLKTWFLANGSWPIVAPHWVLLLAAVWILGNELFPKTSKIRANSSVEAIFNLANKLLLPVFGKVPGLGQFLHLLDTPEPAVTPLSTPPAIPPAASLVLPFLLIGAMASGCAGGPVFGNCLKNVAAPDAEAVVTAVVEIASNPTGYVEALIELGKQVGPNVVACVAKAIAADEAANAAKAHHVVVRNHLNEYLGVMQAHGTNLSCR